MRLAKTVIDVGLSTNNLEPMLRFWQQDVGLRFDHVLPVRRGQKQYRHGEQGSVIKINHHANPLPQAAPSGYRELVITRDGLRQSQRMVDPDGNRVRLVPKEDDGVTRRCHGSPKPRRTPQVLWRYSRLRRAALVRRSGLSPGR
jgi:lactoylglutathione lyase